MGGDPAALPLSRQSQTSRSGYSDAAGMLALPDVTAPLRICDAATIAAPSPGTDTIEVDGLAELGGGNPKTMYSNFKMHTYKELHQRELTRQ